MRKKQLEDLEPLLTTKETAEILRSSEKTIRRRIDAGDLAAVHDGRMIRIRPADLRIYIAARRRG